MNKLIVFLSVILILTGHTYVFADAKTIKGSTLYEETLSNGLKVFAIKDPAATLAVFQIWYNAGSINEQIGKTGLSHLLEHMMFKGT